MRSLLIVPLLILEPAVFGQGVELTPLDEYERLPTLRDREVSDGHSPRQPPVMSGTPPIDTKIGGASRDGSLSRPPILRPPLSSVPPASGSSSSGSQRPNTPRRGYVEGFGSFGHYEARKFVDLREFLPPPGKQSGNSCFAWAAGYASYTCQISQERHLANPSEPWQTFSPDYIFEGIANSEDGVNAGEISDFLELNGCATVAACKFYEKDKSDLEGKLFLTEEHERATCLDDIKVYLSQGYPVVLVVQLDAEFKSNQLGKALYKWKASKTGNGKKKKPQYHAICAVGFNSNNGRVLVMNSYGRKWKDGGFCWVDETSLSNIGGGNWCAEAHIFKVEKSRPLTVTDSQVAVEIVDPWSIDENDWSLPEDGSLTDDDDSSINLKLDHLVYNARGARISPVGWHFDDVTLANSKIFGLRDNFEVFVYAKKKLWMSMTEGLSQNEKITMIAGSGEQPLHALTTKGQLVQADEDLVWKSIPLTNASRVVDVRTVDGRLFAATDVGLVFEYINKEWKEKRRSL